ncbi:MAG TPA: aldehyde dehydrogenase family protein [Gaiellaceae bacterium]|nr:aldehyde dehydrogenase family protein [Gaiellaceae bacterium]
MATASAPELVSVNPATLEPVGSVPRTDPGGLRSIVAAAAAAQEQWRSLGATARGSVLREAGRVVRERADEIADVVCAETAKPRTEAIAHDLYPAVDHAAWLARNAARVLADEPIRFSQLHLRTKKAWLLHEPLGVVAAITPWNIPFGTPFTEVATALAAGNGVVLKPSELTPLTGEWVARVVEEAGAPAGLVQVVQGDASIGAAVVDEPGIAKVFFTGSVAVGRRVAAAAGARGCPVVLELGGKDPMVVFADADLERALDGAVFASFINAGQACVSAERIYAERPVYEEFARGLAARARELRLGVDVGPLISERQRDKVEALTGARRPERDGWFLEPTVIEGALPDEEIFGPVVTVEPFDGEDDAVRRANGTEFGLAASVWTRDLDKARRVSRRIDAGMVWVNDFGYSFATGQAAWGGVKGSGFGRTSSRHGLYECTRVKYVDEDRGLLRPAWWFPYDARTEEGLRGMLDVLYGSGGERLRAAWRYRRGLLHVARRSLGR